ncbi:ABC transporter substrate-binding protein [Breznakiella homolactica]|uniref:Extracellular solute-binding protein n=1 Tax=Breznakiella homolactica TaxID=2798577 RepID=A0A7T7XPG8_9SPIR|nr:extracellular solute-binding protein [Breznakiella homolactica]QQO10105.1 extracellular solute-binding protein [Breznakiella homolactica]
MKKVCLFMSCCILTSMMLISCGGGSEKASGGGSGAVTMKEITLPEGPVTINMMGGAHLITTTQAALKKYMADHPNVTINFEKYSYAEYPVKMRLQLSNGDAVPDVVLVHDIFIPQFVKSGWLLDLTDMIPMDQVLPTMDNASAGGRIYGLPNQASTVFAFMYRGDVYDQLGLEPPETWDEYFEQALKLKDAGYYAGAMDPANPNDYFLWYMGMLGGSLFDRQGKVSLYKAEEALEMLKKAYDAGVFLKSGQTSTEGDYWTVFNEGKIAAFPGMSYEASRYLTNMDPKSPAYGNLRLAPAMRFSQDGPLNFSVDTTFFSVNKNSKNLEAALHLVQYLTLSEEGCLAFANVDGEGINATYTTAYIPGIRKVVEQGTTPWPQFGGQRVISDVAKILLDTLPSIPYKDARSPEAEDIAKRIVGDMFVNGKMTPAETVAKLRTELERL